jgi:acyl-CoA synthetase (AMP-forming)/AMP-acid ligase II
MFINNQYSQNIAVITDCGVTLTYAQLFDEIESFNSIFQSRGLICCLCKNTIGSFVGYVAGISSKNPLILLDGGRDMDYVSFYIKKYSPEYVWASSDRIAEFAGSIIYEKYGYSLVQMSQNSREFKKILHDNLSLCLTTSGSTGSPKLVRLTKINLESNAESIAKYLNITERERPITTLPMYYSFGLSVINSHLIRGATILLTDSTIFSKSFWTFFEDNSPTSIAGVPFTYEMLEKMGFFQMKISSTLKTMIQAGGKLNANIVKRYVEFASKTNRSFIVMYGQTEASPRMSYLPFEYADKKPSSIGIPIPGGEFLLYDINGQVIQRPNIEGELVYKGFNVCMGYAECREDLSKGDENKGLLKTGDIAYRDADGFYYITGRLKRFVKIWGNRYNLDAIEQLIKSVTSDCACVGNDNKIHVVIESPKFVEEIKLLMEKKLQLDKSCYSIIVMDIPKTLSGKIQYTELMTTIGV